MRPVNSDKFIKEFYSKEKPCILNDFSENWDCLIKWNYSFFQRTYPKLEIKYNIIPDGEKKSKLSPPFGGNMLFFDFRHLRIDYIMC